MSKNICNSLVSSVIVTPPYAKILSPENFRVLDTILNSFSAFHFRYGRTLCAHIFSFTPPVEFNNLKNKTS